MPVVDFETYGRMLDHAQKNDFAFPAINVTSMTTANAALKAFADANSDGIIQVSTGGGEFASGLGVKDSVAGAITIAEHKIPGECCNLQRRARRLGRAGPPPRSRGAFLGLLRRPAMLCQERMGALSFAKRRRGE